MIACDGAIPPPPPDGGGGAPATGIAETSVEVAIVLPNASSGSTTK